LTQKVGVLMLETKMRQEDVSACVLKRYPGLALVEAWGEQSLFYNPDGLLPRGVYFATLKDKDGDNDKGSMLNRDGVFRFNFGVSQPSFEKALGKKPARPRAGKTVDTGHDFTRLNTLLPHPVYAWMCWVCILNPDTITFRALLPLLDESFELAVKKYSRRLRSKAEQNH